MMQVLAPAKINLALRILGRRRDGFHEIETLIAPISLCDRIKIEPRGTRKGIKFQCDNPAVPKDDECRVVQAAKLFLQKKKIREGVSIQLKKQLPPGAGLGGGSSDAAPALLAL